MTGLTAAADDSFLRDGVFRFAVFFILFFSGGGYFLPFSSMMRRWCFSAFLSANWRMFPMVVSCPSMIFKRSLLSVSNDAVRDATSFCRAVRILACSARSAASSSVRVSIAVWRSSILPDATALPVNGLSVSSFANLMTASSEDLPFP